MALDPLATGADLSARGVTPDDTSLTFLAVASQAVRDAAGCPITSCTSTIKLPGSFDTDLRLPGPVTDVSAVLIDDVPVTNWVLRQDVLYRLPGWWNLATWWPSDVTVTLTFGLAVCPDDIIDLVCSLAGAGMGASQDAALAHDPRMTAEAIDDYRISWAVGPEALATAMSIPQGTRDLLRQRFGKAAQVTG